MNNNLATVFLNGLPARVVKITPYAFVVERNSEKGVFPISDFSTLAVSNQK